MSAVDVGLPTDSIADDVPPLPGLDPLTEHPGGKRGPGRPRGATTDPRIKEATRTLSGKPPAKKAGRPPTTAKTSEALTIQLAGAYAMCGTMFATAPVIIPGDLGARIGAAGEAMAEHGDECAKAIVAYSERNAQLRRFLETAGDSAGLLAVVLAHVPILLAATRKPRPVEVDAEGNPAPTFMGMDMADIMRQAAAMDLGSIFPGAEAPPTDLA